MIPETLTQKKQRAGRIGGLQTFFLHGREEMRRRGRLGGRPRNLTYEELLQQSQPLKAKDKRTLRRMDTPGALSLTNKRLDAAVDCQ